MSRKMKSLGAYLPDKERASERQDVGPLSARGAVNQVPLLQLCSTDMRLLATW